MNNVTMTGHLTKDPNLRHLGDRPICELRIAVDNGRHPTTYIDVTTFDGQAYACAEYLAKGRKVGFAGKLAFNEWIGADGQKHHRYSVIGRVEFLDRPPQREAETHGEREPQPEPVRSARPELAIAA
jgi:single-strand DNA-binding protein